MNAYSNPVGNSYSRHQRSWYTHQNPWYHSSWLYGQYGSAFYSGYEDASYGFSPSTASCYSYSQKENYSNGYYQNTAGSPTQWNYYHSTPNITTWQQKKGHNSTAAADPLQQTSTTSPVMSQLAPENTNLPTSGFNDSGYYGSPSSSMDHLKEWCPENQSTTMTSNTSCTGFDDLLPLSPLILDLEQDINPLSPTSITSAEPVDILAEAVAALGDTLEPNRSEESQQKNIVATAVATLTDDVDPIKTTPADINAGHYIFPAPTNKTRVYRRRNKQLNQTAITIMTQWFESHLNHPYPTQEEKELMAQKGGIALSQVISWFNNKRNRSANTAPKKQKRKLEEQLSTLCHDLITGSRSGHTHASQIAIDISKVIEDNLAPSAKKRRF